jgi:hypothetical protein
MDLRWAAMHNGQLQARRDFFLCEVALIVEERIGLGRKRCCPGWPR